MSDKESKHLSLGESSSSSSSSDVQLKVSLQECLLEVARGLRGSSEATLKLHSLYLELKPLLVDNHDTVQETHRRIGELRVETASFSEVARTQISAINQLIAVAIDNRQSVDASRFEIAETHREITASHRLMTREDLAALERTAPNLMHKALDFVWPHAIKASRTAAVWWSAKLIGGSAALAALGKLIQWGIAGSGL